MVLKGEKGQTNNFFFEMKIGSYTVIPLLINKISMKIKSFSKERTNG